MSGHTPWREIEHKVGDKAQTRPTQQELEALKRLSSRPKKEQRK